MITMNEAGRIQSITTDKDLFELDIDIKKSIADSDFKKPIHVPIIIINGQGSSGKDTAIHLLNSQCMFASDNDKYDDKNHNDKYSTKVRNIMINNISSIDPIRSIKYVTDECDVDYKSDAYRTLLHDIKKAWVKYDEYGPTNYIIGEIKKRLKAVSRLGFCEMSATNCFFVHIREKEEIDKLVSSLKTFTFDNCAFSFEPFPYTLLITDENRRFGISTFTNSSDRDVFKISYDCKIYNDSTLTVLQDNMMNFMTQAMYNISLKYNCI